MNTKKLVPLIVLCLALPAVPFARQQPVAAMSLGNTPESHRVSSGASIDPGGLQRFFQGSTGRMATGSGFYESVGLHGFVDAITTYGNEVYVSGDFNYHSQGLDRGILLARWTYVGGWETLAMGPDDKLILNDVNAIAVDENYVYVGGWFTPRDMPKVSGIARWSRSTGEWSSMGQGVSHSQRQPYVTTILPDGYGNVYVGGDFSQALPGAPEANNLAIWDSANACWWSLAQSVNGLVYDLALKNGKLYVVGNFTQAGGGAPYYPIAVNNVAMWDGTWHALGEGLPQEEYASVFAIDVDANGKVYAGSFHEQFERAIVLQWDPATGIWSPLGAALTGWGDYSPQVYDLYVDGYGVVFASGLFDRAGRTAPEANNLAKFDQGNWYSLAQSMPGPGAWVSAITIGSDGYLYAVGTFEAAGGPTSTATSGIARFDGGRWWPLTGLVK